MNLIKNLIFSPLLIFLFALPIFNIAQNTGGVTGIVTDSLSGEPLVGANIMVVGGVLGTASDK